MPPNRALSPERPHAGIGVLVVDDFAETRENLKALLQEDDRLHVVGEARNGVEAIRAFDRFMPDVVSMNVNMSIMDGITVTRIICGRPEGARVVILSVVNEPDYILRALYAGAADYLAKPPVPQEYLDTLKHVASCPPKRPPSEPISRFLDSCARIESAAEQVASRRGIRLPPCTDPSLPHATRLAEVLADAGIVTSTILQSLRLILQLHDRIRMMTSSPSRELHEALSASDLAKAADIAYFFQSLALEN